MPPFPALPASSSPMSRATKTGVPTQTIATIVFGICAVMGTIFTVWQGHKSLKLRSQIKAESSATENEVELQSPNKLGPPRSQTTVSPRLPDVSEKTLPCLPSVSRKTLPRLPDGPKRPFPRLPNASKKPFPRLPNASKRPYHRLPDAPKKTISVTVTSIPPKEVFESVGSCSTPILVPPGAKTKSHRLPDTRRTSPYRGRINRALT